MVQQQRESVAQRELQDQAAAGEDQRAQHAAGEQRGAEQRREVLEPDEVVDKYLAHMKAKRSAATMEDF